MNPLCHRFFGVSNFLSHFCRMMSDLTLPWLSCSLLLSTCYGQDCLPYLQETSRHLGSGRLAEGRPGFGAGSVSTLAGLLGGTGGHTRYQLRLRFLTRLTRHCQICRLGMVYKDQRFLLVKTKIFIFLITLLSFLIFLLEVLKKY